MAGGPKRGYKTEQAIAALLRCPTLEEAAAETGVATRTLRRWLHEPDFRQQYLAVRRQIYSQAIGRAQQTLSRGVGVLHEILDDPDAPPTARVAAFARLEEMARRGVEIEDLETRLTALEMQLRPERP